MKIIYITDDGIQFDNKQDCLDHEWELEHPHLKDVQIFDKNNNKLENVFAENTYHNSETIVIPNNEALKDFQAFVEYTGHCAYENINQVGKWKFDTHKEMFCIVV